MCEIEKLNLQLFAGEGGGGDGGAASGGTGDAGANGSVPGEQTKASWDQLMEDPDYKAASDKAIEKAVKDRLKKANASAAAQKPIMERLAKQYGVAADDYQALSDAMDADAMDWEALALEKGTTVEAAKREYQTEQRATRAEQQLEALRSQEQSRQQMADLLNQAEQVKAIYPGFDLDAEMNNENFVRLVANHVPVQTAFEVAHHSEIVGGAIQAAAQDTRQKIAQSLQSRSARPREGAMGGKPASTVNLSVAGMSKAEKDAFRAAVRRGEAPWRK